jgi:hypothetical protein
MKRALVVVLALVLLLIPSLVTQSGAQPYRDKVPEQAEAETLNETIRALSENRSQLHEVVKTLQTSVTSRSSTDADIYFAGAINLSFEHILTIIDMGNLILVNYSLVADNNRVAYTRFNKETWDLMKNRVEIQMSSIRAWYGSLKNQAYFHLVNEGKKNAIECVELVDRGISIICAQSRVEEG